MTHRPGSRALFVADDFGLCAGVDQAIVRLARARAVNAVSVLATAPGLELGPLLETMAPPAGDPPSGMHPQLGLHLDLTWGRPLSSPASIPTLVGPTGRFWPLGQLARRLTLGQVHRAELVREVRAQWDHLRRLVPSAAHLDGHQHVHLLPGVLPAVLAALESDRAPGGVRLRLPLLAWGVGLPRALVLGALAGWHRLRQGGALRSRDCRPILADYNAAAGPRSARVEVMLHVAQPGSRLPGEGGSYPLARRVEQLQRRLRETA